MQESSIFTLQQPSCIQNNIKKRPQTLPCQQKGVPLHAIMPDKNEKIHLSHTHDGPVRTDKLRGVQRCAEVW